MPTVVGAQPQLRRPPPALCSADATRTAQMVNAIVQWQPATMQKLECPAPIVAMRAALARTPAVRPSHRAALSVLSVTL